MQVLLPPSYTFKGVNDSDCNLTAGTSSLRPPTCTNHGKGLRFVDVFPSVQNCYYSCSAERHWETESYWRAKNLDCSEHSWPLLPCVAFAASHALGRQQWGHSCQLFLKQDARLGSNIKHGISGKKNHPTTWPVMCSWSQKDEPFLILERFPLPKYDSKNALFMVLPFLLLLPHLSPWGMLETLPCFLTVAWSDWNSRNSSTPNTLGCVATFSQSPAQIQELGFSFQLT